MLKKRFGLVALAVAALLVMAACGSSGSGAATGASSKPQKGGTLTVLQTTPFSHLDPVQGYDTGVIDMYQLIYSTLTAFSSAGSKQGNTVVPELATNLGTHNSTATVWTFHLKPNVKFSNGQVITSQDVKFGTERAFDPQLAVGSPYAKLYIDAPAGYQGPYKSGDLSSIQTPNPTTIVFHLNQPVADFASALTEPVFTPMPDDPSTVTVTSVDQTPISSGPYEVKSYQQGASLDLVRNPNWHTIDTVRKALPDKINFQFGLSEATVDQRMVADENQDIDAISGNAIQPSTVPKIQQPQVKARALSGSSGCTTYLVMNTTKPALKTVAARQAIAYAVNKEQVLDADGGSAVADIGSTMLPPNTPGYVHYDLYPSKGNTGNVAKAKQLLAQAHVAPGTSLILDTMDQAPSPAISEAIQQSLQRIGLKVTINLINAQSFYQTIGTTNEQHDLTVTGWCPDWANGVTFLPPLFEGSQIFSEGNSNVAQLNNPAVNAQITAIEHMTDTSQANAAWTALDKQIAQLAPTVPLFYARTIQLFGSNVGGGFSDPQDAGYADLASIGLLDPSK